jgi:hypothetical protein
MKSIVSITLLLLQFACVTLAFANDKQKLRQIANLMAREGNMNFILVHLYNDGLIMDDGSYDFDYSGDTVKLNGEVMRGKLHKKYLRLSKEHVAYCHLGPGFSMRGHLTYSEIINSQSSFRTTYNWDAERRENEARVQKTRDNNKELKKELANDNLIKKGEDYTFAYNINGVFLNNKKLTGVLHDKYWALMVKQLGYIPQTDKDGMHLSSTY